MKKPRLPQLALRLDAAAPDADAQWRAGGVIAYLGGALTLKLDTACRLPERVGSELHLPLPPAATARQIRDAAESWLRDEALRRFAAECQKSTPAGRIVLTFGKHSDWVKREGDVLRCHWRLIEQPPAVIEQVLGRAQAALQAAARREAPCADLFALI
jgi:hypothetical protein